MRRFAPFFLLPFVISALTRWKVLESEHFRLAYPYGYDEKAQRAVAWMETERERINEFTGWEPRKVWVVLEDIGMGVNGFANPVGNEVHLFTTSPLSDDLGTRDWIRHVGIHEYVHIASLEPVYGLPRFFKFLLGPWVLPNAAVPGWMIEGVTVYQESRLEPYEGRLQSGFFDANLLTRTAQGAFPKRWEMDGSITQFPGGGSIYAYGGPFFEWLVEEKGADKVADFYRRNGDNIPAFFIDGAANKAFGDRFPDLLAQWRADCVECAASWVPADSAARRLTHKGWYANSLTTDGSRIYYVRTTRKKRAALYSSWNVEIVAIDPATGEQGVVTRPNASVQSIRVHDGVLYYTALALRRGFSNTWEQGFGELYELHSYDLVTDRQEKIYSGRIRAFDRMPDGSFLISVDRWPEYGSRLIKLDPSLECDLSNPFEVYSGDLLIGEIAISDKGKTYYSARKRGESWEIYEFKDGQPRKVTNTGWAEAGLSFDSDGNLVYYANPYGPKGYVGAYLFTPETGTHEVFQTPSYVTYPVRVGDELCFLGLRPEGYDVYTTPVKTLPALFPKEHDIRKSLPDYNRGFVSQSRFRPYSSLLRPWARIPYILPQFDTSGEGASHMFLGGFLMGADILGENSYNVNVTHEALSETNYFSLNWNNQRFAPLALNLQYRIDPISEDPDGISYAHTLVPSYTYPIVYRPGRGLNIIRIGQGLRMTTVDSLKHRLIQTNLGISFSWPYFVLSMAAVHDWESPWFSESERSTLAARLAGALYLAGGVLVADFAPRLDLTARPEPVAYRFDEPIRGYEDLRTDKRFFAAATLEYRHRLLRMRFGIWNPNVFFEDLYVNVFADAGFDSRQLLGFSTGFELVPEIHFFWGYIRVAPVMGFHITAEGKTGYHWGISASLPLEISRSRKDPIEFISDPWMEASESKTTPLKSHLN
ncbi:hypothetical protein JXM67_04925 [candidate division WOR-3 bacterium]|nr:hypothetical protein [candidate division WOR-3 bacterium]